MVTEGQQQDLFIIKFNRSLSVSLDNTIQRWNTYCPFLECLSYGYILDFEIARACTIQSKQCASYHEIMGVKVNQICRIYCSNLHALPILKPVMCRRNVLRALVEKNHICLPICN